MGKRQTPKGSGESVVFSAITVLFMLYWNYGVITSGAPFIFPVVGLFGLYVTVKGFVQSIKEYRARKMNQDMYDYNNRSSTDYYHTDSYSQEDEKRYCMYCGSTISSDFIYCPYCGRKLNS